MDEMNSRLINYQKKLQMEYNEILEVLKKYSSKSVEISKSIDTITEIYDTKVKTLRPQIMVYGIYNAGKSSIINALIREEKAKVADIPTTDRVDMYAWNGYQIADTPGVGAPIKHEMVTNQQLKKADVVLFVMSTSGSFEYEQNYIRMKDIINAGKRVLIILNDKEGYLGTKEEQDSFAIIKQKIVQNMKQIGIENSIDNIQDQYQIITVNADDAKTAIEENDADLFNASNMPELEKAITYEMKKADSFIVLRNSINEIEKELQNVTKLLEESETREELKDLNQILKVIRERKINLRQEMQSFISIKTNRLGSSLPEKVWAVKDNNERANSIVDQSVKNVIEVVQKKLNDEFLSINEDIKNETAYFIEKMQKLKVDIDHTITISKENISANYVSHSDDIPKGVDIDRYIKVGQELLSVFNQLRKGEKFEPHLPEPKYGTGKNGRMNDAVNAMTAVAGGKELMNTIAPNLAKNLIPSVIAKSAAGKALSTVIPYVGPIIAGIQILSSLFGDNGENERLQAQVAQENAREQQRLRAEEQARQSVKQNCEFIAEDLRDNLILNVNEVIRNTLGGIEKVFTSQVEESKDDAIKLSNDINKISGVINNLNRIHSEIEA